MQQCNSQSQLLEEAAAESNRQALKQQEEQAEVDALRSQVESVKRREADLQAQLSALESQNRELDNKLIGTQLALTVKNKIIMDSKLQVSALTSRVDQLSG